MREGRGERNSIEADPVHASGKRGGRGGGVEVLGNIVDAHEVKLCVRDTLNQAPPVKATNLPAAVCVREAWMGTKEKLGNEIL